MKQYINPARALWPEILERPKKDASALNAVVRDVLDAVRAEGDVALREYEEKFDHVTLTSLAVSDDEMQAAEALVSDDLKRAIALAHRNIYTFHAAQRFEGQPVEVTRGVTCWQRSVPIERVGLYIPGGTAPLLSTVLMLATPARIAGCREIVLCTPPQKDGTVCPAILVAARTAGVSHIYKVGGVQAIGAMAYGTATVPRVDKIFGPGNQYVMCAKQQVSLHDVAIDMPAGPSEVAVVADATCRPAYVAADLLSQAEHGMDSQVLLLTDSEAVAAEVQKEVERQLQDLPRRTIAEEALSHSRVVVLPDMEAAMEMTNQYAPEHLILAMDTAQEWAERVVNAGSVFLGHYSCESAGDYASGTNHTLPTSGYARAYSGVNLDSYCRKITFQSLTREGVEAIGPAVESMAQAESLEAHRRAMSIRRK